MISIIKFKYRKELNKNKIEVSVINVIQLMTLKSFSNDNIIVKTIFFIYLFLLLLYFLVKKIILQLYDIFKKVSNNISLFGLFLLFG